MDTLVSRIRALEHGVHDAMAARRDEFAGGVAYSNPTLPAVWDVNFVRLDRPCADPAREADRLQPDIPHRRVVIEERELFERFGPGLRRRGFGERRIVALARAPGGRLDDRIRVMPYDALRALRRQVVAEQFVAAEAGVIGQVVEAGALTEAAGGQWLAFFEGNEPVAHCVLFSRDGLVQIEDVATLMSHRERGLARRLLEHALELVAPDHDTVFITAEADDWPLAFYERLGFRRVEERSHYLLLLAA